jgi:hypothetical protein
MEHPRGKNGTLLTFALAKNRSLDPSETYLALVGELKSKPTRETMDA